MEREPREDEKLLNVAGKEYLMSRNNTSFFSFVGRAAFNHVFLELTKDCGAYVFRTTETAGTYDALLAHIQAHNFPQHLNLNDITDQDKAAYFKATFGEVPDTIPDDL